LKRIHPLCHRTFITTYAVYGPNTYEYRNDESLYLGVLRIHKWVNIHLNTSVSYN